MNFTAHRKIWYAISAVAVTISVVSFALWGLRLGIEFTGGSLAEYTFTTAPQSDDLKAVFIEQSIEGAEIVSTDHGYIARMPEIALEKHTALTAAVVKKFPGAEEVRFDSIGPSISNELRSRAITAILATLLLVFGYVAWAFRKASGQIESWKYGALVVLAGLHDAIMPIGVFSIMGHFYGTEVSGAFIAAILTILGYSINDTIVVFDRIRENLLKTEGTIAEIVERSIHQTLARSINTTMTVLLALAAVYFFGGHSTKDFSLALIVGVASGAYSSIFLASPLLVDWQKKRR